VKISLLCTDHNHPVNEFLSNWISLREKEHEICLIRRKKDLPGGNILFLISCSEIITSTERAAYDACLVLHASDLPRGRGWSPHIWQVINGAEEVTLSLLEAEDIVDSGRIWFQSKFTVPKHALWDEINHQLFSSEIQLIELAVASFKEVTPIAQTSDVEPTYYRKRKPDDSKIDPQVSIASQFDKIRVCDPHRFPAYFELHGHRYKLILEKIEKEACN
jgi:methionyl-tRNA formyltransferase